MEPIDKPFRFTWDFCVVWAILAIPALAQVLSGRWNSGPWYSNASFLVVVPFIATFFVYGPVLLVRQIIHSGTRGWFVARVFLSILLVTTLFFVCLYIFGRGKDVSSIWGCIAACAATLYLHVRTDGKQR
jgi:hypothetical protein